MSTDESFQYKGYEIPVRLIWLTGAGPDAFDAGAQFDIDRLERLLGLSSDMRIVEIGCGIGRDAIPLTERLSDRGAYLGIDINKEQIAWCSDNISRRHPNFRFEYWDVREDWYNPAGTMKLSACRIPEAPGSVDRIILQSVFSHLLPDDLSHYLREFCRILKPEGRVLATCYVMTDEIFGAQRVGDTMLFHAAGDGFFVRDPVHPTQGVAYTSARMRSMMDDAGIEHALPPIVGSWSGKPTALWQDVIFLKRRGVPA